MQRIPQSLGLKKLHASGGKRFDHGQSVPAERNLFTAGQQRVMQITFLGQPDAT
ncbi:MAG TPA: hypothetical protein VJU53_06500 [Burkholderiaceae bacterium]|nr:hypothetical protein [Burkholderiaceae bacterium]